MKFHLSAPPGSRRSIQERNCPGIRSPGPGGDQASPGREPGVAEQSGAIQDDFGATGLLSATQPRAHVRGSPGRCRPPDFGDRTLESK